jgi:uncharacterized OsmC-like protein
MPIIKSTAKLIENVRTIADNSRTHSIVMDLPTAKDGADTGPTALEVAIMSLADCAVTIFADVAKKSGVTIQKMDVIAEAEKPADSPILSGVKIHVKVSADARSQKLRALWRRTEANCPVVAIFKEPIPITIEFETDTN